MKKIDGVVYKIVSKKTKKIYIGSTKNFDSRKRSHIYALNNRSHPNPILQRHCDNHGIEDLVFDIIERHEIESVLRSREKYYIIKLDPALNPDLGNHCLGVPNRKSLYLNFQTKKDNDILRDFKLCAIDNNKDFNSFLIEAMNFYINTHMKTNNQLTTTAVINSFIEEGLKNEK